MNVLIAVDGGETSPAVIDHAHALFGDGPHYSVVTVGALAPYFQPVTPFAVQPALMWVTDQQITAPLEGAESAASEAARESELEDVEIVAEAGDPGGAICRIAEERDIDVAVVGTVDRGWLSRLVRPSVSHHVADHAPCHVLLVRGFDGEDHDD